MSFHFSELKIQPTVPRFRCMFLGVSALLDVCILHMLGCPHLHTDILEALGVDGYMYTHTHWGIWTTRSIDTSCYNAQYESAQLPKADTPDGAASTRGVYPSWCWRLASEVPWQGEATAWTFASALAVLTASQPAGWRRPAGDHRGCPGA